MTNPDSIAVNSSRAFPGPGEQLNKPGFKSIEFDGFKNEVGSCSKGVEFDHFTPGEVPTRGGIGFCGLWQHVIPPRLLKQQIAYVYASEEGQDAPGPCGAPKAPGMKSVKLCIFT